MADGRPPSTPTLPLLGAYLAAAPPPALLFPPTSPPTPSPSQADIQAAVAAAVAASPSSSALPGGVLAVVLAGGQGSRFVAPTPKVLVPFRGRPLAAIVVGAATDAGAVAVAVVGHAAEQVVTTLGGTKGEVGGGTTGAAGGDTLPLPSPPVAAFVLQEPRLGTGHAVAVALEAAVPPSWAGAVLVLCADTPGVDGALLVGLLDTHRRFVAADARHGATVLTGSRSASAGGGASYGRIVRAVRLDGAAGTGAAAAGVREAAAPDAAVIVDIVEKKTITALAAAAAGGDARTYAGVPYSAADLDALDEFNSGVVVADAAALRTALGGLAAHPTGGGRSEYYATDFVVAMAKAGRTVRAAAMPPEQVWRVEGANTVEELAALERRCEKRERGTPGGGSQEKK